MERQALQFTLSRDGKDLVTGDYGECVAYIHRNHPYSFNHALQHEGFAVRIAGSLDEFQAGTRVALSREYCKATGAITGEIPFMRGQIVSVLALAGGGYSHARVAWDGLPEPMIVNLANLVREDRLHLEAA